MPGVSGRNYASANLSPFEIPGTADVIGTRNGRVIVIDWKLYQADGAKESAQGWHYAIAACRALNLDEAEVHIVLTKGRSLSSCEIDALELAEFAERLREIHARVAAERAKVSFGVAPDTREGMWCKHCPAKSFCPSKTALIRSLSGAQNSNTALTNAEAADGYRRLVQIKQLVKDAEKRLEAWVVENGSIDLGNGMAYGPFAKRGNERLDARTVIEAMKELFGDEAQAMIDRAIELSVTKAAIKRAVGSLDKKVIAKTREMGGVTAEITQRIGEYMRGKEEEAA